MDEVDRNGLEEFRQLRQEVRHSEEYSIVPIYGNFDTVDGSRTFHPTTAPERMEASLSFLR
jgi:hypothetical protein